MKFNENEIEKLRSCIGTEEVLKFEVMNHMGDRSDIYARVVGVKNETTLLVTLQTVAEQIKGNAKGSAIELRTNLEQPLKYIPSYNFPMGFLIQRVLSHRLENPIYENSEKTLQRAKRVAERNYANNKPEIYHGDKELLELASYLSSNIGSRVEFKKDSHFYTSEGVMESVMRANNEILACVISGGMQMFVPLEEDYEFKFYEGEDYSKLFEENKEETTTLDR